MKLKIVLLAGYLGTVPAFLFILILYSLFLLHQATSVLGTSILLSQRVEYRALPEARGEVGGDVNPQEARVSVLQDFFGRYSSPLLPFAAKIVESADKYGIDYRLLPAIAMQESTLCQKIPKESYNCWGFGIYGGKVTRFTSYNEAIETISKALVQDYKSKGLEEPKEIMTRYTPGSNGSWAEAVSYVMARIGSAM